MTRIQLAVLRFKLAVVSLFNPWRMVRELREDNERIMKTITDPLLTGINIGNGSFDIAMKGAGPQLLAGMFLGMFEEHPDAKNYIEVTFGSPQGPILVTVQRPNGASPHTLLMQARARIAELEAHKQ